jgi:hypothetical protein
VVTRTLQRRAYLPDNKGKNDAPAPVVLSPLSFCRPGTGRSGRFQGPRTALCRVCVAVYRLMMTGGDMPVREILISTKLQCGAKRRSVALPGLTKRVLP